MLITMHVSHTHPFSDYSCFPCCSKFTRMLLWKKGRNTWPPVLVHRKWMNTLHNLLNAQIESINRCFALEPQSDNTFMYLDTVVCSSPLPLHGIGGRIDNPFLFLQLKTSLYKIPSVYVLLDKNSPSLWNVLYIHLFTVPPPPRA